MCQGAGRGPPLELAAVGGRGPGAAAAWAPEALAAGEQDLLLELERLRSEYQELEAASAEQDAADGVALHDARLERLRLAGLLQRYQERAPSVEDLAERYEAELAELEAEALRLREENALLAARGAFAADAEPAGAPLAAPGDAAAPPRPRSAAEELQEEVRRLRRRAAEHRQRERRARLEEWRLAACREEVRRAARRLKAQERSLEEARERCGQAEALLQELRESQAQRDVEQEQAVIQRLNREAVALREACYLPARLKRESSFVVKLLDQGGGRMKAKQHLKSLEACRRLYGEVAAQAPAALPLASRAKADMEAAFARFQRLEEAHGRALQRLQTAVTRDLLHDKDRDGLSVA